MEKIKPSPHKDNKSSQVKSSQVKSSQVKSSRVILLLMKKITQSVTPGAVHKPVKKERTSA